MASSADDRGRSFESYPLTRPEYISAMVHFYRGELTRANTWRLRLDTSTNWAVVAIMGILSFGFGAPHHSHASIIVGMLLALYFLALEARRYRFFDVWRHRVRMIEENFFCPLLRRDLESPEGAWGRMVAEDLASPRFKITFLQAFRERLLRNYAPIFVLLSISWVIKLVVHPTEGVVGLVANMALGPVPWYVAGAVVASIDLFLLAVVVLVDSVEAPEREFWSDESPIEAVPDF